MGAYLGPFEGGRLTIQDTGLCHSNRKSTTHKSGEIFRKSYRSIRKCQSRSPINEFLQKTVPINPEDAKIAEKHTYAESIMKKVP